MYSEGSKSKTLLDKSKLNGVRAIDQEDAFNMCRLLAKEEGVFGGGSTGLNVCAAISRLLVLPSNEK